jgi:DNA-binding MarR family transcriptional regulator
MAASSRSVPGRSARRAAIAGIAGDLRRIFKAIHEYSKRSLKEFGVTGPQLWALHLLGASNPLSVGDLADRMYLHISTVSGVADRLEERGLVRRIRGTLDRRVVQTRLTSKGRALLRRAPQPAQGKLLHGLEHLAPREAKRLRESLHRLVQLMEVQDVEATFFFAEP